MSSALLVGLFRFFQEREVGARSVSVGYAFQFVEREVAYEVDDFHLVFLIAKEHVLMLFVELSGIDEGLFVIVVDAHQLFVRPGLIDCSGFLSDFLGECGFFTGEDAHFIELSGNFSNLFVGHLAASGHGKEIFRDKHSRYAFYAFIFFKELSLRGGCSSRKSQDEGEEERFYSHDGEFYWKKSVNSVEAIA